MIDLLWRPELSAVENAGGWVVSVLGTVCIFWWMGWSAEREKRRNIERDVGIPYGEWREWADAASPGPLEEWRTKRRNSGEPSASGGV